MKKLNVMKIACTAIVFAAAVGSALADAKEVSLAEASAKLAEVIDKPAQITELMKTINPSNQVEFLSKLNAAIAEVSASAEEKTALFIDANRAAFRGAASEVLPDMIAESFATIPVESLTAFNEVVGESVINRSADPSKSYSDATFADIASKLMDKIVERNASSDNASVRDAFAAMALVRASNGSPADLASTLADKIPDAKAAELAKSEWIPDGLGQGERAKNYDGILGYADAGSAPSGDVVVRLTAPMTGDMMFASLNGSLGDFSSTAENFGDISKGRIGDDAHLNRVPREFSPYSKASKENRRGETPPSEPQQDTPSEPHYYDGQEG